MNLPMAAGSCPSGAGSDDPAGDVHHPGQYTELPAPRGLHQGHRRLVRGLRLLRIWSPVGIRDGELRLQVILGLCDQHNWLTGIR